MDSCTSMKKVTALQIAVKYLLLAIILSVNSANLSCVLEALSAKPFMPDFWVLVLIMSLMQTGVLYFLFIREKKTVYALVCILSPICFMDDKMTDFWGKVFHLYSKNEMKFYRFGTYSLFVTVYYLCIIMVLTILFIRWILIKSKKVIDFKKTEEGYCVELWELSFICDGNDKDYKKLVRTLADAYYQEKEQEMIAYMIHQEAFIQVYGEMTEEEMLEKIEDMEDMPFFPEIFLHEGRNGSIIFYDKTHEIEISFEEIFENLHDIQVRSVSPVDKKQATC